MDDDGRPVAAPRQEAEEGAREGRLAAADLSGQERDPAPELADREHQAGEPLPVARRLEEEADVGIQVERRMEESPVFLDHVRARVGAWRPPPAAAGIAPGGATS
jgi:hypothetical protein